MGEMIAAALVRGAELGDVVLRASNVTVDHHEGPPPRGEYVALTILGAGSWTPEVSWLPDNANVVLVNPDLDAAVRVLGTPWAYTRSTNEGGSVTVFLRAQTTD